MDLDRSAFKRIMTFSHEVTRMSCDLRQKWVNGDAETEQYILIMCLGEIKIKMISLVNFLAFPCEIILCSVPF